MNLESLKELLYSLNLGSEEFWIFIANKFKVLPLGVQDFPWACFPKLDKNNTLVDIRLVVPKIQDEETLLVNIHEFTHAYELYEKINTTYEENVSQSEELAKSKEQEYLTRTRNK